MHNMELFQIIFLRKHNIWWKFFDKRKSFNPSTPATPKVISSQGFAWARGKAHFFPPQRAFSPPVRLICALNYDRCRRCSCHRSHGPGKNSLVALQNPSLRAVLAINGTLFPEYWDCGDKIKTLLLFFRCTPCAEGGFSSSSSLASLISSSPLRHATRPASLGVATPVSWRGTSTQKRRKLTWDGSG